MKKIMIVASMTAMLAGCAFNPEAMPVGEKDSVVYVDNGAPETLAKKESKAKVAVIADLGDYKAYKQVGESLDSSLNDKLSKFSFFQIVDRKSQGALIQNALATGADAADIDVSGVDADFIVVARVASLVVKPNTTKNGTTYSSDIVYDFKWISVASKRVVMTESINLSGGYSQNKADAVGALCNTARSAVQKFCAKIAVKYAPPARVLETRGNGAAARVSLGGNYGLTEDTEVCFYEIVDNSDVGGEKRDMKDIATGTVKRVEEKTSWVKVNNAEETNVRKGVYVRVLGEAKSFFPGLGL